MTEQYKIYIVKIDADESEKFEHDMDLLSSVKAYGLGTAKMYEEYL